MARLMREPPRQPRRESEINTLHVKIATMGVEIERLTKLTSRLNAAKSSLDYQFQQHEQKVKLTKIDIQNVGESTRSTLARVRATLAWRPTAGSGCRRR
jgi:hypothetical protein